MSSNNITLAVAVSAVVAFTVPVQAASFTTEVVSRGLVRPTGIAAHGSGTLYVTQLPTPGVSGRNGGSNTVSEIKLASGKITTITTGEPEPTNLALSKSGELYWTCKSAGVILERNQRGDVGLFLGGLSKPSGIALDHSGFVYFTQVPTPGVNGPNGGTNTVNVSDGVDIEVLTLGEPEPTDITVARDGTAFWTCKSAGVILMRTTDGDVSLVQGDLNQPTGIALDEVRARLYFTQVPTPGVSGQNGGSNQVSVIHLESGALELVDFGDPEPTDITVAENGSLYGTCSSAGVIVEAREVKE
jgi:sugar lactone lactonase YvrE